MTKRYSVTIAYKGKRQLAYVLEGRFARLPAAKKEADRQNARAWFRVDTPADLLGKGSFDYRWRVWDHWLRTWAEK